MKILRVDMCHLSIKLEDLPVEWSIIGGRALTARLLCGEVAPDCDPLGESSKLIMACGPLAGTSAPSCGRFSLGAKSPLTFGIKESNTGGPVARKLDELGIRAIIVDGKPSRDQLYLLYMDHNSISLIDGEPYRGLKNYTLVRQLFEKYEGASIVSIGLAGERQWKSATIAVTDNEGQPSRQAARGGLGAVMGAKGLKAVIIDSNSSTSVSLADEKQFNVSAKQLTKLIQSDPGINEKQRFGTASLVSVMNYLGSMPVRNYSGTSLEGIENLSGENIEKLNRKRGGRMTGCMSGCPVSCSLVYKNKKGNRVTSGLEYETIAMMGSNLGITDPDIVAGFDHICDDLGIDSIEIGSALGVAADQGKMTMGDAKSIEKLLAEIEKGSELGSLLANGVVETCKALGVKRVPAIKGQAIPAHDPRVTKGTGVSYLTSPMGADHTAGLTYDEFSEKEEQVACSLRAQILNAIWDAMGFCLLAVPQDKSCVLTLLKELLNARYGLKLVMEDLISMGKEVLKNELAFNRNSGFQSSGESDLEFLKSETSGKIKRQFDVDISEINRIWDQLDSIQLDI
jgi:aldehyde:ferredoxin oxidoreductase